MRSLIVGTALIAGIVVPAALGAQESGAFVVRLGTDTVSVEQFTRTATEIRGEQVLRSPRSVHRIYRAELAPDGSVRRFELITHNISGAPGPAETRLTVDYAGDTAAVRVPRGDTSVTQRVIGAGGSVPFVLYAYGLMEHLVRQGRRLAGDSVGFKVVTPGQAQPWAVTMKRTAPDRYDLTFNQLGPWHVRLDGDGRLMEMSGRGSTLQVEVARVPSIAMAAMGPAFAARSLGPLSVRDTARATLAGGEIWVDYGRPQKRGRVIFGNVVPWHQVWRTGANAATQFYTPVDLVIGGTAVPAGTYTLWTLPTPAGWKLIVNKQHGQWGTEYHVEQDLARVDMRVEALAAPVEICVITIEPRGPGAVLQVVWDQTRASVEIAKK
ncbi:MAG TPA: DUF2911 domain-containing protein [Gemmatimonadales bacterium]